MTPNVASMYRPTPVSKIISRTGRGQSVRKNANNAAATIRTAPLQTFLRFLILCKVKSYDPLQAIFRSVGFCPVRLR